MALNRAHVVADIGLSSSLYYVVEVEFFDSVAPTTVLWRETFVVSRGTTTTQLQAMVVARGQEVRDAFAARDAARLAVPNGTTITVP